MENKDNNNKNKSIPETEKKTKDNESESFLKKKGNYPFVPNCWAGPLFF